MGEVGEKINEGLEEMSVEQRSGRPSVVIHNVQRQPVSRNHRKTVEIEIETEEFDKEECVDIELSD